MKTSSLLYDISILSDFIHSFHWHVQNTTIPCHSQSFIHSSLLHTLSFHPIPPTSLPSSLTSSCHLFLGLSLSLVASKFIYNNFLGMLFFSILCTCPNQRNLFNLIVSVIVGFFNHCLIMYKNYYLYYLQAHTYLGNKGHFHFIIHYFYFQWYNLCPSSN